MYLLRGAAPHGNRRGKILICLFQRGAADALNIVVPHGESEYYRLRPRIAVPRPGSSAGGEGAIDLGDRMDDVVILTMSEFGRMARENGNGGTDHGHAGAMFVIGGSVRGHHVHGRWPGLAPEQL